MEKVSVPKQVIAIKLIFRRGSFNSGFVARRGDRLDLYRLVLFSHYMSVKESYSHHIFVNVPAVNNDISSIIKG